MSKQFNKYQNEAAYNADSSRLNTLSAVSAVQGEIKCDGVNVVVPFVESNVEHGDFIVFDKVEGVHKIVKGTTLQLSLLDERYVFANAAYAFKMGTKYYFMEAQQYAWHWAANSEYKLTVNLTDDGGFAWSCKPRDVQFSGSVSWSAGATIESVLAQMPNQTGLTFTKVDDTSLCVSLSNYTTAEFAVSGDTGVTVLDCSLSARIGEDGAEMGVHHSWQGEQVKSCFPDIDWPGVTYTCYAKNGVNTSVYTGVNLARFVTYWSTHGEASYKAESNAKPMNQAAFEALGESEVEEQAALYHKYEGDYEKYCAARMYDFDSLKGANQMFRERAVELTNNLAQCVFTAADGSVKHCYPAAYEVSQRGVVVEGYEASFGPGNWCMMPHDGAATIFNDDIMPKINAAIAHCASKTLLTNNQTIRCLGECSGFTAWVVYGTNGCLYNGNKMNSTSVRLALAFEPKN